MENRNIGPTPSFQGLDVYSRDEIYRYLLSTKYTKHPCVARQVKYLDPGPSVLLASTAISTESNVHF